MFDQVSRAVRGQTHCHTYQWRRVEGLGKTTLLLLLHQEQEQQEQEEQEEKEEAPIGVKEAKFLLDYEESLGSSSSCLGQVLELEVETFY